MQNINMPTVTVILTVFERTEFLESAIQSVVAQSFSAWECIISDDANTSAARIISSLFRDDSRIRYRRNQTTLGTPLSIAATLHEARGEYVVILNDDDLLDPKMLEKLVAALEENPQAALAFGNHNVMDADGMVLPSDSEELMRERGRVGLKPGMVPDSFDFAVRGGLMVVMGCLFRKSACDTKWLTPEVAGAYDYWLSVMLSTQGEFLYTSENIMSWRRHTDSLSSSPPPAAYASEIHIYESLLNTPLSQPHQNYLNARLAECFFFRGIHLLENGRCVLVARKFFYKSLQVKWSFVAFRYWVIYFLPVSVRRYSMQIWRKIKK